MEVLLVVSEACYREISSRLREVGFDHGEVIDMNGVRLKKQETRWLVDALNHQRVDDEPL